MKKEFYEKIAAMAREVNENWRSITEDNMAIIIGVADTKNEMVNELCVVGERGGVFEMISHAYFGAIGGAEDNEPNESLN